MCTILIENCYLSRGNILPLQCFIEGDIHPPLARYLQSCPLLEFVSQYAHHNNLLCHNPRPPLKVFICPPSKCFQNNCLHCDNIDRPKSCDILNYSPTLAGTKARKQHLKLHQQKCVPYNVLLLVLFKFNFPGLRNETEASNTASMFLEHTNITCLDCTSTHA